MKSRRWFGKLSRIQLSLLLGVGTLATVGFQGAASAAIGCGSVITANTTLTANITGCTGPGLVIGADNVNLNLAGYTVSGVCGTLGEKAGIWNHGYNLMTLRSSPAGGTVQCFDVGVLIEGLVTDGVTNSNPPAVRESDSNVIKDITVQDNNGGDGILLDTVSNNLVTRNTVLRNGPFDGIGIIGQSTLNTISRNTVTDNNLQESATFNEDDGIRIEPDVTFTTIKNNVVTNSGLDGIAIFNVTGESYVQHNTTTHNGYHGKAHRLGAGIFVFSPSDTDVSSNTVCDNNGHGIAAGQGPAPGLGTISSNTVGAGTPLLGTPIVSSCTANAVGNTVASPYYDLFDGQMVGLPPTPAGVPCLTDIWHNNFTPTDTFNHNCTTNL